MRVMWAVLLFALTAASLPAQPATYVGRDGIKRFLDPTVFINTLEYRFDSSFSDDVTTYGHNFLSLLPVNHRNTFWVGGAFSHIAASGTPVDNAVGDVVVGFGTLLHENLLDRFTSSMAGLELVAPTGSVESGTGDGRWLLAPRGALAVHLTDYFPLFVRGRYSHSLGESELPSIRLLDIELEFALLVGGGFFVEVVPVLAYDFAAEADSVSLEAVVGRAITENVAWVAGYVEHFEDGHSNSRGFIGGLNVIWGDEKVAPKPPSPWR